MAIEQHTIITGPRALNLSEAYVHRITEKKPTILGGTVKSCAVTLVYPRLEIIVGKNKENE